MSLFKPGPSVNYHAVIDDKVVYSGTIPNVAPYIAKKRALGIDVQCGADGMTAAVRKQRVQNLENHVETCVVGYRLEETNGLRGLYLPGLFATEDEARLHRAQRLDDTLDQKYSIVAVNWRGALS